MAPPSRNTRRPLIRRLLQHLFPSLVRSFVAASLFLLLAALLLGGAFFTTLAVLRTVDPPTSAFILADRLSGHRIDQHWVPIERISANLVRAVVASEDMRFCVHNGIDTRELELAMQQAEREGIEHVRGASTITMQVAKNLFLSKDRTLLRKGVELAAALGIESFWTKRRIMEVYLNIAQWGDGIYGAEAAARHYFRRPASELTTEQAALLAVSLPSPETRSAANPSRTLQRLARRIMVRKDHAPGAHLCVYPPGKRR